MAEPQTHFEIFNIPMSYYVDASSFIEKERRSSSFRLVSSLCDVLHIDYRTEILRNIKPIFTLNILTRPFDMTYSSKSVLLRADAERDVFSIEFDVDSVYNSIKQEYEGRKVYFDYQHVANMRLAKKNKEDNMGEHYHMPTPWEIRNNVLFVTIPKITDVEVFDDGLITVKVTFEDGTHTTATCSENDDFDFEVGIGICIGKRALGSKFNSMVDKAVKLYTKTQEEKLKKSVEEIEALKRAIHKEQKRVERIKRREERERQETIDILAEAIKKAHETGGETEEAAVIQRFADKVSRDKAILKLREEGHSFADISRKVGCSAKTVSRIVRDKNKA